MDIKGIKSKLSAFAKERDWDQYHSPKNLVIALAGEVGELVEHFQWLTEEESRSLAKDRKKLANVSEEVADLAIYIVRLCDKLGIDLEEAIEAKIKMNAAKYPVALAKGNATKYTDFKR